MRIPVWRGRSANASKFRSARTTTTFSNDCLGVQLEANCRQADVFIVQPLGHRCSTT